MGKQVATPSCKTLRENISYSLESPDSINRHTYICLFWHLQNLARAGSAKGLWKSFCTIFFPGWFLEIPEISWELFLQHLQIENAKKEKKNSQTFATSAETILKSWGLLELSRQFPGIVNMLNQDEIWNILQ